MMRNLGGEIDRSSIQAIGVGPDYPLTQMPQGAQGEEQVRPQHFVLLTHQHAQSTVLRVQPHQ